MNITERDQIALDHIDPDLHALLQSLQIGDHVRIDGKDAMYGGHCIGYGWWLRIWLHNHEAMIALPNPPESEVEFLFKETMKTLELISKPQFYYTNNPIRGDWFYIRYTIEKPMAYIYWDMAGPYGDDTYTIHELNPWTLLRYRERPGQLKRHYGWTNYIKRTTNALHDRNGPIQFFQPPFLPDCLKMPNTQLKFTL